jgi:hypothetical protein
MPFLPELGIVMAATGGGNAMTTELRDKARAVGLDRLTDEHLAQFERAIEAMRRHLQRVPRDLPPAQELALIFRAKGGAR